MSPSSDPTRLSTPRCSSLSKSEPSPFWISMRGFFGPSIGLTRKSQPSMSLAHPDRSNYHEQYYGRHHSNPFPRSSDSTGRPARRTRLRRVLRFRNPDARDRRRVRDHQTGGLQGHPALSRSHGQGRRAGVTNVTVKLKDGRTFCGPLWEWRPKEGWFSLVLDMPDPPDRFLLADCESAVDHGVRVSINRIEDVDILERAKRET